MVRVLFVCLGNICRSPTADGVFRKLVAEHGLTHQIESDSAGVSDYHAGEPPDERAMQAAGRRGIDLRPMRARQVLPADFTDFDLVLAMDRSVFRVLVELARTHGGDGADDRVGLFMDYAPHLGKTEVPDPYLGGSRGFDRVLDLIEEAVRGLLDDIRSARSP
ncbi:MAG: low molecular weight protein-tyrosine-phosphatase [Alphaproteobacteria bacterium]